jgi:hypothetical protein
MAAHELVISREDAPLVALGMTSASFDSAQRAGVIGIEADTDAMAYIARRVGYAAEDGQLSPLVILTRDTNTARNVRGRWDDRLPADQDSPNTGRFFPANHLVEQTPITANRELFVEVARVIGAPALTEVSISSWSDDRAHPWEFAAGLLTGQRPLDLLPADSLLRGLGKALDRRSIRAVKEVRANPTMPKPFIVRYDSDQLQLEG